MALTSLPSITAASTAVSVSDAVLESESVQERAKVLFWEENHPGLNQNSFLSRHLY